MTIARHYRMDAPEGKGDALLSALKGLSAYLPAVAGYEGADLLRDEEQPHRFIFIEKWSTVDAHKAAATQLPKEVIEPLMAALAGPPEGAYLAYIG